MRGDHDLLEQLVADFEHDHYVKRVGQVVESRLDALANEMAALIVAEIPAYAEANESTLRTGWKHGFSHARKISDLLQGRPVGDLSFVNDHAAERAEQRFALNDILHTYRIGHRVMWRCMRDAAMELADEPEAGLRTAMAIADFTIRYTNLISVVLTRGYTARERFLSNTRVRQVRSLFDELSHGRIVSAEARLLADSLQLDTRPFYLVSVYSPGGVPDTRQPSVTEAIERHVSQRDTEILFDDRNNGLRALVVCADDSAASRRRLLERLRAAATETNTRIGLSVAARSPMDFSYALAEAAAALRYTDETEAVADLAAVSVHQIYIENRHLDVERLLPAWHRELLDADSGSGGALAATIAAYADADLSVKGTARALEIHPNTVRFRLNKIEKITGISPKSFRGMQELLTVLAIASKGSANDAGHRRIA